MENRSNVTASEYPLNAELWCAGRDKDGLAGYLSENAMVRIRDEATLRVEPSWIIEVNERTNAFGWPGRHLRLSAEGCQHVRSFITTWSGETIAIMIDQRVVMAGGIAFVPYAVEGFMITLGPSLDCVDASNAMYRRLDEAFPLSDR